MEVEYPPILEYDDSVDAVIEPKHFYKPIDIPDFAVICFFKDVLANLFQTNNLHIVEKSLNKLESHPISAVETLPIYKLNFRDSQIIVFFPGIGSPIASAMLEEVIALGCKKFICCGSAGVLDGSIPIGHILIPAAAIRDEGVSYHYLPPSREVAAHPDGIEALKDVLKLHKRDYTLTKTWTTDAIYRETQPKLKSRRLEGCLAVEMEAASLFAVAQFRRVKLAQILYASDDVSGNLWDARFWPGYKLIREELFWIAIEACFRL